MDERFLYSSLADALLILHGLLILFVIGGFILVLVGYWRRWSWIRNPWFRLLHLAAIATVVVQTWVGASCPLTVWENRLRRLAGREVYGEAFIEHWLHELIFYEAEAWVFGLVYTAFGALVLLTFILVPPRLPGRRHRREGERTARNG